MEQKWLWIVDTFPGFVLLSGRLELRDELFNAEIAGLVSCLETLATLFSKIRKLNIGFGFAGAGLICFLLWCIALLLCAPVDISPSLLEPVFDFFYFFNCIGSSGGILLLLNCRKPFANFGINQELISNLLSFEHFQQL